MKPKFTSMIGEGDPVRIMSPGVGAGHTGTAHITEAGIYVRTKSGRELGPFEPDELTPFEVLPGSRYR